MLAAIGDVHDEHHERTTLASVATLAAARADGKLHVLLASTGSVATIKLIEIARALSRHHATVSVRVVLTAAAARFLAGQSPEQPTVSALGHVPGVDAVYMDEHEWGPEPWRRGAGVLHVELRRWADLMVVAPLSANSLAKAAGGIADSLVLSVLRAWDTDGAVDGPGAIGRKRIIVAPAMNTAMWRHPVTARHIALLESDWGGEDGWFDVMLPQTDKMLACGDVGEGAMCDWHNIVEAVEKRLGLEA